MDFSFTYNDQLRRRIYKVKRDLTIQLDDLSKLEPLLTDLLKEENLKVGDISFVASNTKRYEIEARRLAVADARARAEHLAELNGLTVDKAIDIRMVQEYNNPFVTSCVPVVGSTQPRMPQDNDMPVFRLAPKTPGGTKIQFVSFQTEKDKPEGNQFGLGKISITAKVSITFELKK